MKTLALLASWGMSDFLCNTMIQDIICFTNLNALP